MRPSVTYTVPRFRARFDDATSWRPYRSFRSIRSSRISDSFAESVRTRGRRLDIVDQSYLCVRLMSNQRDDDAGARLMWNVLDIFACAEHVTTRYTFLVRIRLFAPTVAVAAALAVTAAA